MQNANPLGHPANAAEGKIRFLVPGNKPKLLDQLRETLRARHYSRNRADLSLLGEAFYTVSPRPPSGRDDGTRDQRFFHLPRGQRKSQCTNVEPEKDDPF